MAEGVASLSRKSHPHRNRSLVSVATHGATGYIERRRRAWHARMERHMQGVSQSEATGKSARVSRGKKAKRPLRPGSQRKCWLCVVYGDSEEDKARLQMNWSDDLGELDWADGHSDNLCPAVNGRAAAPRSPRPPPRKALGRWLGLSARHTIYRRLI